MTLSINTINLAFKSSYMLFRQGLEENNDRFFGGEELPIGSRALE